MHLPHKYSSILKYVKYATPLFTDCKTNPQRTQHECCYATLTPRPLGFSHKKKPGDEVTMHHKHCFCCLMYRSNRSFNMPPPPGQPLGNLTFLKIFVQIPPYPGQNAVQMPHTRVHSGDQMPPPRGHFTGTKMTEGRRKRLQLSKKIFMNITKTERHY